LQYVDPSSLWEAAPHGGHVVARGALLDVPSGQGCAAVPPGQKFPGVQGEHVSELLPFEKVPGGHGAHCRSLSCVPAAVIRWPAPHAVAWRHEPSERKVPAAQQPIDSVWSSRASPQHPRLNELATSSALSAEL
jgi:hypothetical protein